MKKLFYGWVMVALGALMTCVAVGAMFSLAVFLKPIQEATGWSRAGVSAAMTLNFLTMGLGGFLWGTLSDRYGPRPVVLAGSVLLGIGLAAASRATSLVEFQLAYGVLVGFAAGSFFAPMIASVANWFDKHRSLAVSLVSVGVGVAPMTISPLAAWLIQHYDWRTSQLVIAILAWGLLIPASVFVRTAPAVPKTGTTFQAEEPSMRLGEALRSTPFIVLSLTFFACCAAHSGPIFHTISYAIFCGIPTTLAVTIYSVEGLAGLGGRLGLGLAADRFGVKPVLIAGLVLQALAAGTFAGVSRLEAFYAVAALFGFAYGGVMPLYAVLAREYFGQRIMGTVFGAATMLSSIGMSSGPLIGGFVFDTFGSYAWMFIGSSVVGIGAMAVALAFPPQPSRMRLQTA